MKKIFILGAGVVQLILSIALFAATLKMLCNIVKWNPLKDREASVEIEIDE